MIAAAMLLAACGSDDGSGAVTTMSDPSSAPSSSAPVHTSSPTSSTPATSAPTISTLVVPAVAGDFAYADVSDEQRLDLYTPSQVEPPYPLVVIIHGGGWTVGDKRGELPSSAIPGFLDLGYAVASVNYRLAPAATFPAQLLDVKAAIRFLRARADVFGIDPDRFAVVGESAGAHLALLLGTTEGVAEFDDPTLGNADVSSAVQAVIDFYGPSDLTTSDAQRTQNATCPSEPDPNIAMLLGADPADAPQIAAAASPVTYLHEGQQLPPFFIAHGDADCIVPYQQSVEIHDAIEAVAPGTSQLVIVPGSGHYLDFDFQATNEGIIAFLHDTIGRPQAS